MTYLLVLAIHSEHVVTRCVNLRLPHDTYGFDSVWYVSNIVHLFAFYSFYPKRHTVETSVVASWWFLDLYFWLVVQCLNQWTTTNPRISRGDMENMRNSTQTLTQERFAQEILALWARHVSCIEVLPFFFFFFMKGANNFGGPCQLSPKYLLVNVLYQ